MTENDKLLFIKAMIDCFDYYDKPINEKSIDLYFRLLEICSLDDVLAGLEAVLRSSKFFPKASEVIEQIEGKENEIIDFAYQEAKRILYKGFHFPIRLKNAISMQVIQDMGGQHKLYNKIYVEGENDTAAYFEWSRIYKNYYRLARAGKFVPAVKYLPGYMSQLENARPVVIDELPLLGNDYLPAAKTTLKIGEGK